MTLKESLAAQIKDAMKARDKVKLGYARFLHAAIRKKEIDDRIDLDDGAVLKIIANLVKQRQDAAEQFKSAGREDLVAKELDELQFLQTFLPPPIDETELKTLIEAAVGETKASSVKDLGAVLKLLLPKLQGRVDGKLLQQLVRERLI